MVETPVSAARPPSPGSTDPERTAASGGSEAVMPSSGRGSSAASGNTVFASRPTNSNYAVRSNWNQPMLLKANSYRLKNV